MKKSSFFKSDVLIFIMWIYIDLVSLEKFCSPLFPYWFYFSLEKVAANAKKVMYWIILINYFKIYVPKSSPAFYSKKRYLFCLQILYLEIY